MSTLSDLARSLAASDAHHAAVWVLSNVPGAPPIIQTVHLLSVAAVMGSIVLIALNVLGFALPSQNAGELTRRLAPWMWWAMGWLLVSGMVFVLARPQRYFSNPVFGVKLALLAGALAASLALLRLVAIVGRREGGRALLRIDAGACVLLWIAVVFAGRWIAYVDYLFFE